MSNNKFNPLKIIASTSVTLFSLFACFVSTFAWFLAQRSTDADGNGFVTTGGVQKVSRIDVYKEDEESSSDYVYSSSPYCYYTHETGWMSSSKTALDSPLPLGKYSTDDPSHSCLILLTLTEALDSYELDLVTKTGYSSSKVNPANKLQSQGNELSSFVDFRCLSLSSALSSFDLNSSLSAMDTVSFVDPSSPSSEEGYSTTRTISGSSSSTRYIALAVEYNVSVVNYILYTLNFNSSVLNSGNDIAFSCDWRLVLR